MPRQPDAPSPLARRWAFASVGSFTALATALLALVIIGPNLPVPDIQWPGEKTHPPHSPSHHSHAHDSSSGDGSPGRTQPRPGPELIPSISASPGSPSAGIGMLDVTPQTIHLRSRDKIAELYLAAKNGPVTWAADSSNPSLTLSKSSGGIHGADRVKIKLILQRGLITLAGAATVTLTDGTGHDTQVKVAWDPSLL